MNNKFKKSLKLSMVIFILISGKSFAESNFRNDTILPSPMMTINPSVNISPSPSNIIIPVPSISVTPYPSSSPYFDNGVIQNNIIIGSPSASPYPSISMSPTL